MAAIVVPFRGAGAKLRLGPLGEGARRALALAMLGDVLAAAAATGETTLVSDDADAHRLAHEVRARVVADPGRGQGEAVAAALAALPPGAVLVVNADLPCALPEDLRVLLAATPAAGLALVPAADGTTNALGLRAATLFAPLFGTGSARRFRRHAESRGAEVVEVGLPNLADDVDTLADLRRLHGRVGPRTRAALATLPTGLAA